MKLNRITVDVEYPEGSDAVEALLYRLQMAAESTCITERPPLDNWVPGRGA